VTGRRLVSNGHGPKTLFTLAVAYRSGRHQDAGWSFATSPQIEALITKQVGHYARHKVREQDLEDLRSDLRVRVLERLGDARFRLPSYHVPSLNESALVAYFRRALMDLAQRSMREIVGHSVRRNDTAKEILFSQMPPTGRDFTIEEVLAGSALEPFEIMERARQMRVLTMAQRFFASDEEARIGFLALYHRALGLEDWDDISEAVGLGAGHSRAARGLAMRWRNILKAALIEAGEAVEHYILGVYTSLTEAAVCLLSSSGASQTWVIPYVTVWSAEALANRILRVLSREDVVTYAALNLDDHSSPMRIAAMRALHYREPLVERYDISWLEAYVTESLKGLLRFGDGKRRAILLAQAKLAECQLKRDRRMERQAV
jgi:hypothetical protein